MHAKEELKTEPLVEDLPSDQALPSSLDEWANDGGSPVDGQITKGVDSQRSNQIGESTINALNQQIQHEQSNAHAYQALSLYFRKLDLHGLEDFMAQQAEEERAHANKFIQHVCDRKGRVELLAISAPDTDFDTPLHATKHIKNLEISTTLQIHRLYEHACNESDYALQILLHWFITEQVEEEKWSAELVSLFERFNESPAQLLTLDRQWARRVKA